MVEFGAWKFSVQIVGDRLESSWQQAWSVFGSDTTMSEEAAIPWNNLLQVSSTRRRFIDLSKQDIYLIILHSVKSISSLVFVASRKSESISN